ncbi:MAG TPA: alpha/beta hydrolase [Nitrolancea sp.]|nr:alpha/beta hydrolase [Nitrolancea sp.]
MDSYRASGRMISVPGRQLFAIDQGSGAPVLFLHGIPTYSYLWRHLLPVVALNHRVIALDLPGFGLSEKHPTWDYSVAAAADAVRSSLRQLDIERVAIVAHDFGALVAAELISRESEFCSHLVLLNTSFRPTAWTGGLSPLSLLSLPLSGELALALSRRWMLRRAMSFYVRDPERLTADVMAHYWWPFAHGFKATLLNLSRNRSAGPDDFTRWRKSLQRLTIPCLIAWGADDPTFTLTEAHDLKSLILTARLRIFERANHFVPEDQPLATGRLINAFLAGFN